jgi:hypothetical protein
MFLQRATLLMILALGMLCILGIILGVTGITMLVSLL